jgi:hypothetical protein
MLVIKQFLGLTEFLNSTEIKECKDEMSGQNTLKKIFLEAYFQNKERWIQHCPLPCTQKLFDFNYQMYHNNNILEIIDGKSGVNMIKPLYSSLVQG